jgi:phospholipase C
MMENRSFDHFMGWLPNADGRRDPRPRFRDNSGKLVGNYHLTERLGCAHPDPDHSYEGGRHQWNNGKMDGFASGNNDKFAVGYYNAADRPFMSQLALNYTTCDRYFCGVLAETYPNRFFMHAGQTDRLHNSTTTSTLPTIWDQLNQGGPTGKYYFSDVPFLALWGAKYLPIAAPYEQFLADAAAGTLPNVAYVDPRFLDEGSGTSGDDHPHADIRAGDAFLAEIFFAVANGAGWDRTLLVINYDEWGGFYDHVPPPRVTAANHIERGHPAGEIDNTVMLGFRVPCIVASPFTKGDPNNPRVAHGRFDHTSVLRMIESNFKLRPMTPRERSTNPRDPGNLDTVIGSHADAAVPASIPLVTPPPISIPCNIGGSAIAEGERETWAGLVASPLMRGWR